MRSVRSAGEESWPLALASPSVVTPSAASEDRTIFLDEDVTISVSATGAALSMTCEPGRGATITVVRAGEVVLEETIEL